MDFPERRRSCRRYGKPTGLKPFAIDPVADNFDRGLNVSFAEAIDSHGQILIGNVSMSCLYVQPGSLVLAARVRFRGTAASFQAEQTMSRTASAVPYHFG